MYYDLLNQADLLINASSLWAGFSATVEAMYRRTAVLTAPYSEFQALFGEAINFGAYLSALTPEVIAAAITNQLQDSSRLAQQQEEAQQAQRELEGVAAHAQPAAHGALGLGQAVEAGPLGGVPFKRA